MFDMNNVDEVIQVITIGLVVAGFLLNTNRHLKAIELCKECLLILKNTAGLKDKKINKSLYKRIYFTMWSACRIVGDSTSAIRCTAKILQIHHGSGERLEVCELSINLAVMFLHESKYAQAKQISEKALLISREISHRKAEACCYRNLGMVYASVSKYYKARDNFERSLVINKEIKDRNGEASCYADLGIVYRSTGQYENATEHLEKSLAIQKEIGDRNGEATCYENLGLVYLSFGKYEKAKEHLEKSLAIRKEIGDRNGEADGYTNLGIVYNSVGESERKVMLTKGPICYRLIIAPAMEFLEGPEIINVPDRLILERKVIPNENALLFYF